MAGDRTELHNLASERPEQVKALAAQWDAWALRVHAEPSPDKGKTAKRRNPKAVRAEERR
jgi:hypothetical protein